MFCVLAAKWNVMVTRHTVVSLWVVNCPGMGLIQHNVVKVAREPQLSML